jgi:putative transposase
VRRASYRRGAYAERWVRSVKEECLFRLILFGERALWHALTQYEEHYYIIGNAITKGRATCC